MSSIEISSIDIPQSLDGNQNSATTHSRDHRIRGNYLSNLSMFKKTGSISTKSTKNSKSTFKSLKEIKSGTSCNQSYDDENYNNVYTDGSQPSTQPESQAPMRVEPPIRVRDMINLYNFATQKNQELAHAKSIYFGGNMKSTPMELSDLELAQQQEQESCDGICLKMPVIDGHTSSSSSSRLPSKKPGNFRVTTANDQTSLRQSLQADVATGASVEKSYQSKTTIRRTEQGVRIIIDIFFDKSENDIDIVGSRVETDIPESRILADFQQHSLAMRSQKINQQNV